MSTYNPVNYEHIQTTHRTAIELALYHGYESVNQLAESLPENANVLDAGAGDSSLGREVATLRPDIQWTNFDYSYYSLVPDSTTKDCPPNLSLQAGDITKLNEFYEPESFDATFSYWMLPHMSLESDEPVREAAKQMFIATKLDGLLSIGPDLAKIRVLPLLRWPGAFQTYKDGSLDIDDFAEKVVSGTQAEGYIKQNLILTKDLIAPYFGTSRFIRGRTIYDPVNDEYINLSNPRTIVMARQLAFSGVFYAINRLLLDKTK
jgi:hypothetical protein